MPTVQHRLLLSSTCYGPCAQGTKRMLRRGSNRFILQLSKVKLSKVRFRAASSTILFECSVVVVVFVGLEQCSTPSFKVRVRSEAVQHYPSRSSPAIMTPGR
ncbi:hypothetical protein HBI44_231710 [Parastagonospora nodorum]|nr:hypothetical protein HBI44_231710 [Parastagonospora nodorum]